jgi:hypothetical protein
LQASEVATKAGITESEAWELYGTGLKRGKSVIRPPIQQVLEKERTLSTSYQKRMASAALDLSEADPTGIDAFKATLEARRQEGQIAKLARGSSMQGLVSAAHLSSVSRDLAEYVRKQIERAVHEGTVDIPSGLEYLRQIADVLLKINTAASRAFDLERAANDKPSKVIEMRAKARADEGESERVTWVEAELRLQSAQEVFAHMRRLAADADSHSDEVDGDVIDLGMDEPEIGLNVVVQ